ncbi:MAG: hypothetical protein ACOCRU_01235 [bacterium]
MREVSDYYFQYSSGAEGATNGRIDFICEFSENPLRKPIQNANLSFADVQKSSKVYWKQFWNNGGVIDLSESKDPRAEDLERRIVLSQYLTAIQCSGSYPPQETGLTCNSWYGKFHLEMHFWHAAHFPLWGRKELLEKSLWWYHFILDRARELASSQGYEGASWPKMVGPDGYDSPSSIGPFLIWQQPHPIIYAELLYSVDPDDYVLNYFKEIVFATAEFMVSFAEYDPENDRYILGSPLIPAQECYRPEETLNPTFELEYWHTALNIAQEWRERMGLDREKEWQIVIDKLSDLPVKDNVYISHEKCPDTFVDKNIDHPSMIGAYGVLPGYKVDSDVMNNTLEKCLEVWNFDEVWGWDLPMLAMTAA